MKSYIPYSSIIRMNHGLYIRPGGCHGHDGMVVDLPRQSVPITCTTKVESLQPALSLI
jgi:hypothetical protein